MKKKISSVAIALAVIGGSSALTVGTAHATTINNCYGFTWSNGQLVPTSNTGCTATATGTSGSSSGTGGTTSGTGTSGTVINNCNTGCTGSATGTSGTSWWKLW